MAKLRERPGPWSDLFDPFEMDHACDAVREAVFCVARGGRSAMHGPLRQFLIRPLWAYIEAHWRPGAVTSDVQAAYALEAAAADLADKFEEGCPFDDSVADAHAQALRLRWLEFIAHGCGVYGYHELPKRHAQRVAAPKGKRRGWSLYVTADDVAPVARALAARHTYEDIIAALCEHAERGAPPERRPKGEPDAAAKRAYDDAVAARKIPRLRSKRRSERDRG